MILVLTGTHHQPFDRLVAAAAGLGADGEDVVVQAGASAVRPAGCRVQAWWPPDDLARLADEAAVIVSHGGPGSLFLAWERGRVPVVVPRDPSRGEHVDDHQQRFARTIEDRARVVWDVRDLAGAVDIARTMLEPGLPRRDEADPAFVRRFAATVRALVRGAPDRSGPPEPPPARPAPPPPGARPDE